MLGETSSGKSALINSIFDKKILVESVKPTTGVATEVITGILFWKLIKKL